MTEVTPSELKLIFIEIVIVAIIGIFLLLYQLSPIDQETPGVVTLNNNTGQIKGVAWNPNLVSTTLGLPIGFDQIIIVSGIFLVPMTIINVLTLIRISKDLLTQWV